MYVYMYMYMYVIYIDVCMYIRATSKLVSSHVKEMRKIKIFFCYKIKIIFLTSHICMYIYICKCVCVCVCVCVHIERKRDERVRGRGAAHVYVYVYVCVCVRVCMSEFVGEARHPVRLFIPAPDEPHVCACVYERVRGRSAHELVRLFIPAPDEPNEQLLPQQCRVRALQVARQL